MFTSICDNNIHICCRPPANSYSSESEYEGNVDVGCTINLVDKIAMRDSESECTTDSWAEDESDVSCVLFSIQSFVISITRKKKKRRRMLKKNRQSVIKSQLVTRLRGWEIRFLWTNGKHAFKAKFILSFSQNVEPAAPTTALDKEVGFLNLIRALKEIRYFVEKGGTRVHFYRRPNDRNFC